MKIEVRVKFPRGSPNALKHSSVNCEGDAVLSYRVLSRWEGGNLGPSKTSRRSLGHSQSRLISSSRTIGFEGNVHGRAAKYMSAMCRKVQAGKSRVLAY